MEAEKKRAISLLSKHIYILINKLLTYGEDITKDVLFTIIPYALLVIIEYPSMELNERKTIVKKSAYSATNRLIDMSKESSMYRKVDDDVIEWIDSSSFSKILDELFSKSILTKKYNLLNIEPSLLSLNKSPLTIQNIKETNDKIDKLNKFINNDETKIDMFHIISKNRLLSTSPFNIMSINVDTLFNDVNYLKNVYDEIDHKYTKSFRFFVTKMNNINDQTFRSIVQKNKQESLDSLSDLELLIEMINQ